MSGAGFRVSVATPEQVRGARDEWNALVQRMRHPVVFLSWEWITSWMDTVAQERAALILFVREPEGRLVAILPLARWRGAVEGMPLPVTALTICGSMECYPDHLDIVCAADSDGHRLLDACFEHLRRSKLLESVLYFPFLAGHGFLATYLSGAATTRLRVNSLGDLPSPCVDLRGGYAAYLAAMGKKKRYNLNRERKILCEENAVTFARIPAGESKGAIESLFDLHERRARDKSMASTFKGSSIVGFHQALATKLGDQLRLYQLQANGLPIASIYGFVLQGEFSFYQAGFDPAWKKLSPGKILISLVMEQLAAEEVVTFDFLGGSDEYKQFWATGSRPMSSFIAFTPTASGSFSSFQFACGPWPSAFIAG